MSNREIVAIKIFNEKELVFYEAEVKIYEKIRLAGGHKNILKMISFKNPAQIVEEDLPPQKIAYIELEWADYGSLFDFLKALGSLEKELAHFYFIQMINAIYFLHSIGISHRDIKPENLLLNEDFCLKIADFGLSSDETFECQSIIGSLEYLPNELHLMNSLSSNIPFKFENKPLDIYEAGITFFNMFTGIRPWGSATEDDKMFMEYFNDLKLFWNMIQIDHSDPVLAEFKIMFERMTKSAKNRISIEEIITSKLYKIPVIKEGQVYDEMVRKFFEKEGISRKGSLSDNVKQSMNNKTNSLLNFGTKIVVGVFFFLIGRKN